MPFLTGVLLNVSANNAEIFLFITILPVFFCLRKSLRPTARNREDRPFFYRERKKEKVHEWESDPSFSDKRTMSHRNAKEAAASLLQKQNPSELRASAMRDAAPRLYRGIFSWRISAPGTMLYRGRVEESRKFMEILDTYWIKVFYGMSGGRVALPNIRWI